MGLGLGLGNVQKSLADMMAKKERDKVYQHQLEREQKGDEIAMLDRFYANATPNETEITPELAAMSAKHGFGSREKTLPALQAQTNPLTALMQAMPGAQEPVGPALTQQAPQDLSTQMRKVVAPTFQQQQVMDATRKEKERFDLAQTQRKEDLSRAEANALRARDWQITDREDTQQHQTSLNTADNAAALARAAATGSGRRGVLSRDAQVVTDLKSSLSDLAALRQTLAAPGETGGTGTIAKIGANVPNVITEMTGFGTDAKKKQAMINRVKQVIGKTLEGGVLRKEDELKYEKILPTIGDVDEVIISKLNGLEQAIQERMQHHLESLAEAGYDTSGFLATPARAVKKAGGVTITSIQEMK
jgi:hypothetical protein